MSNQSSTSTQPPFDPATGTSLVPSPGAGPGHWAGAPGAFVDGDDVYLAYRLRWPRPRRGAELVVARGYGDHFTPIWRATREQLRSASIERCAIVRAGGSWRLYVSYVDEADARWRIDVLEARAPDAFDVRSRRPALTADMAGAVAVNDPWLRFHQGRWLMFVSYGALPHDAAGLHGGGDALSTGLVKSETGLATSEDGLRWTWVGKALAASGSGWDRFTARLTCALGEDDGWLGFYDGSAGIDENYEERCGLARSADLVRWERLGGGPHVGAAGGPGTVRYVECVQTRRGPRFFLEYTLPDGSHELRTAVAL